MKDGHYQRTVVVRAMIVIAIVIVRARVMLATISKVIAMLALSATSCASSDFLPRDASRYGQFSN